MTTGSTTSCDRAALELLQSPLSLPCGIRLRNRLAKPAMTEGLADAGQPTIEHQRLYADWAAAGFGLLVTGNVQVDSAGLERPGNVVIERRPDPVAMGGYRAWARSAKAHGAVVLMQLSHAGRQTPARVNPRPGAPSAIALKLPGRTFGRPAALTDDGIGELIQRYALAAVVAQDAGFDGVQVHGAHGYLVAQFLSPLANHRTDRWGGSLANRARFLRGIVRAIRTATGPDFAISVKLNSSDFQRGGFDFDDSLTVAGWLHEDGVDLLELSGGSYEQPAMMGLPGIEEARSATQGAPRSRDGYFLAFAEAMSAHTTPPLMLTGGLRTAEAMGRALAAGIDMVGVARPACGDLEAISDLLAGRATELVRHEHRLRIAPRLLSADSPLRVLKMINGLAVLAWFNQAIRMRASGRPFREQGALRALWQEILDDRRKLRDVRRTWER